jgi:hypothetical protein
MEKNYNQMGFYISKGKRFSSSMGWDNFSNPSSLLSPGIKQLGKSKLAQNAYEEDHMVICDEAWILEIEQV